MHHVFGAQGQDVLGADDLGPLRLQNDLDVAVGVRADVDVAVEIPQLGGVAAVSQVGSSGITLLRSGARAGQRWSRP